MNRLDLGVVVQSVRTELTAQTGLLEATERSLVGDHVVVVDPDSTVMRLVTCSTLMNNCSKETYPALRAFDTRIAVLTFLV